MMTALKIVFFGTPEFAATSLTALVEAGFNIVAVVTAPDKPAGRGMQLKFSAVKEVALAKHIPILQPTNLKASSFIEELKGYGANLQVVIAFRMLPEAVWNMPKLGTLNLHASLLPDYRGAAPINWAIINGEIQTGVSTFFLKHEIDTGDILTSDTQDISTTMNAGELHDLLMQKGAKLMVKTLNLIASENYHATPQQKHSHKIAPKIFKKDCEIDWNKKGIEIYNLIRGLSPYPAAHTLFEGKVMKLFSSVYSQEKSENISVGNFQIIDHKRLRFACNDGWIEVNDLQLEGKKRMTAQEFLIGYRPKV